MMNSKEALEILYRNCPMTVIREEDNISLYAEYLVEIIKQDLERLEKLEEILEKENELLNETKDSVDKVIEDLGKINEENAKLKKAIEILKGRICVHNQYICYDAYADIRLKDNEIELLKEVLGYESCNI